jgi:hypothetical protein
LGRGVAVTIRGVGVSPGSGITVEVEVGVGEAGAFVGEGTGDTVAESGVMVAKFNPADVGVGVAA